MFEKNLELQKNERVIMYIRKHIFFLLIDIFKIIIIFILPVFGIWFLQYVDFFPSINIFGISLVNMSDIVVYIWAVLCWLFLAEKFTKYALNFWVLTNKRIVESDLTKLFERRLSVLELPDVEDITLQMNGLIGNMIGFGSLEVQTAGAKREFIATNISNPVFAQETIFAAKLNLKKEEASEDREEYGQISEKIINEKLAKGTFGIPHDQAPKKFVEDVYPEEIEEKTKNDFDWAHNLETEIQKKEVDFALERVEDKYRKNAEKALRVE